MRLTLLVFGSASPFMDFCLSTEHFSLLSFVLYCERFKFIRSSVMQQYSCDMSYEMSPGKLNAKAAVKALWMLWFVLCLRLAELQPNWALNATISLLDSPQCNDYESAQWTLLLLGPKFYKLRCGKNANCEMNDTKLSFNTNWRWWDVLLVIVTTLTFHCVHSKRLWNFMSSTWLTRLDSHVNE